MKSIFCLILACLSCLMTLAQNQSPLKYLETVFPKLTEIYRDDIDKCHAHYIFTVDVSGSMDKFEESVVPSLEQFIQALPNGDKVTVMPFGTDVICPMGFSGTISDNVKGDLCRNIKALYKNANYDKEFKDHTDLHKALNAMFKSMTTNNEYQVNVLICITDFLNNIPLNHPYKRRLTEAEVNDMRDNLMAASTDMYVKSIALELSENGGDNKSEAGYCLDQIRKDIFSVTENGLEKVNIGNNKEIINEWFEQLRRDILVVKLTAIVEADNKACSAQMQTEVDIDGNVKATINLEQSRLYNAMTIDTILLSQQGFRVEKCDKENYESLLGKNLTLDLGKIKHEAYGFHALNDSLNIGISFPTQFDNELTKLKIKKPLSGAKANSDRWIFTFPLPLWLTVMIAIAILAYIVCVIKSFVRNKKEKMKGRIMVTDNLGNLEKEDKIKPCTETSIGKAAVIKVDGAEWRLQIKKQEPSPLLFVKRPRYVWTSEAGYVSARKGMTMGELDYRNNIVTLECKARKSEEATHKVKIVLVFDN